MPRATPMSADERRAWIIEALLPLLVERGGEVRTKEIAEAAGVAEGTIFRVFTDKRELMLAAAEEAMNPAGGAAAWEELFASTDDLRTKVGEACRRVTERIRLTMTVMMAVRA